MKISSEENSNGDVVLTITNREYTFFLTYFVKDKDAIVVGWKGEEKLPSYHGPLTKAGRFINDYFVNSK